MSANLRDKTLIMLVSPSAIGKSTIVREVLRRDKRFRRVRSFTTRQPRPDDEVDQFFYLTPDELTVKRADHELITEVHFPTTGQTYGTIAASYDGEYCLLETLAHSVEEYRSLDFKRTVTISITAPAEFWRQRFVERYPEPSDEAKKRLDEAEQSIRWSLAQTRNHTWLVNDQSAEMMAQKLIDITLGATEGDDGHDIAADCLAQIQSMWS